MTLNNVNNLQRFSNENALMKQQIRDLAAETEAANIFMEEQLQLLKKHQKLKRDDEKHSNGNAEFVQLLRQLNASLLEKNASKNELVKIPSENLSFVNKNVWDTNSKPEKIYETLKRKCVTKGTHLQAIQAVLMTNFVLIKTRKRNEKE